MEKNDPFIVTSREELNAIVEIFPSSQPKILIKFVLKDEGDKTKWNAVLIQKIKESIGVKVVTGSGYR